jgi:Domain of unknown function (DUF4157)
VGRLIQAKLTVGEPNDVYEQEADRVAAEVVSKIHAPQNVSTNQATSVQRQVVDNDEKELRMKPLIQCKSDMGRMAVSPEIESSIQQARGSGQPLAESIRTPMEQAFGTDFSGVRVHTDERSDRLNRSVGARAFTTGQDVFFKQGEYSSGSRGGQELLAHELTHVVQQNSGISCNDTQQHSGSKKIARTGGKACTANSQLHHAKVPDTLSTSTPLLQARWPFDGPSIFSWEFWGYSPAKTSSGTKQLKPRPKAVSKGKSERNGEGDKDGSLKNEETEEKIEKLIEAAEKAGEELGSIGWSKYEKEIKEFVVSLKKDRGIQNIENNVYKAFNRGAEKEKKARGYIDSNEKNRLIESRKLKEEESLEQWKKPKERTPEEKEKAAARTVQEILEMVKNAIGKWEIYGKKDANVKREGCVKNGPTFYVDNDIKDEVYQKLLKLRGNTMFGGLIYIVKKSPPNIYNVTLHKVDRNGEDTFETLANVHIEVSN